MKKRVKNEQGYALLTVLLTIVLFMILFLAFMGQAFSSVKQNREIEKSSQSVALAEAGITYYHNEVKGIYEAKQEDVYNKVKLKIDADRAAGLLNNPEDYARLSDEYKKLAADYMELALKESVEEKKTLPLEGKPEDSIIITVDKNSIVFNPDKNAIHLNYTVLGSEENKESKLTGELTINMANPDLDNDEAGPSITFETPKFDILTKPEITQQGCTDPPLLGDALKTTGNQVGCTKLLIQESKVFNESINNLENTLIYSDHDLSIGQTSGGNINSAENVKIHANNLSIKQNVNNLEKSIIETDGNAIFSGHLTTHYSRLYIGGDLTVLGSNFNLENSGNSSGKTEPGTENMSSLAYVRGNVKLNTAQTALGTVMCVKGDLTSSSLAVGGELYIQGKLNVNNAEKTSYTNTTFVTSATDTEFLKQKCGATFAPPELFIGWGEDITNNIIYH